MKLATIALAVAAVAAAHPAPAARRRCPPERAAEFVALIRASNGEIALLIGRIPQRMSTDDVACWAATGDKKMILELGKRLESGDGIPADVERAEEMFEQAAAGISGTTAIYIPGSAARRAWSRCSGPDPMFRAFPRAITGAR